MQKGLIIVISAPSGAGKTTICKKLVEKIPGIEMSVSASTRKPRGSEVNGVDYFFIDEQDFLKRRSAREFIEWAKVHGNYYGTFKKTIDDKVKNGINVLLDIDVIGALNVKKRYKDSILIFILPPSLKSLESRLRKRKTDDENAIKQRMKNAKKELEYANKYDYLVVNKNLTKATADIISIINAEKCSTKRLKIKKGGI